MHTAVVTMYINQSINSPPLPLGHFFGVPSTNQETDNCDPGVSDWWGFGSELCIR